MSYVNLQQANEYIESRYTSSDALREAWEELSPEDREVLLNRAFDTIESLPFVGRKWSPSQQYQFPRWPMETVPLEVQNAQIELAISMCDADAQRYAEMRVAGISEYRIGNLSEKFRDDAPKVPLPRAVELLLGKYLAGGYKIRGGMHS